MIVSLCLELYAACKHKEKNMSALLEQNYLEPVTLKLQKHFKVFEAIIKSFPMNYFNMADVFDLEEVSRITVLMNEQSELMRLNKPDSKSYERAAGLYLRFSKQVLSYKAALRISSSARNGTNRTSSPVSVAPSNSERNNIISSSPFDSGIPAQ